MGLAPVGGVDRRLKVMAALHRAGLAAARTDDPDALYDSVIDSLQDVGFFVSIYVVEAERARMVRSSFGQRAVKVVERHTGLRQDSFSVALDQAPWFRQVLESPDATLFETSKVLGEIFPGGAKWLAGPVARAIKIRSIIGARVLDEGLRPSGLLFLLGNDLTVDDVPTASVFAQLLSVTLGRLRLTRELSKGVEALRATQAQLVQTQKMEAVGRLTGGLAHDLNNMLTPALFSIGELETGGLSDADYRENVAIVRQALERCADLTRSMLAFGRRQMLARRYVVFDDVVGEAVRLVRASFPEPVRVEWLPGAGAARVHVDVTQVQQVLVNLALNAREAMPSGGTFTVSTGASGGWVELACRDTGVGIAPDVLPRIFEPFFSTRGPANGSGLGLSVVDGIVQQHGGTLSVESQPGTGTRFCLRFREEQREEPQAPSPPKVPTVGRGRRVLVVEDDLLVRRTLVRVLKAEGFQVSEAASLTESRALRAKAPPFELVVTDVVLPDGKSTEETLAMYQRGQPVLFVTGHPLDSNWSPVELARVPVLMKPFGPGELLAAVGAAFTSRSA